MAVNNTIMTGVTILVIGLFAVVGMSIAEASDTELQTTDYQSVDTTSEWEAVVDVDNSENYVIENDQVVVGGSGSG